MKNKIKKIITIFLILLTINSVTYFTNADVGSFDRYDSGGSSWSGSSGGSSYSSSSGSYSYSGLSSSGYSGGDFGTIEIIILFIIVASIVITAMNKKNRRNDMYNRNRKFFESVNKINNREIECYDPNLIKKIKAVDPEFNEEKFLTFAKNLYVRLQNAWTERNWEPMRTYESVELFEQHRLQLQAYIDTNRINVVDRIAVNYAKLYDFKQEGGKDILSINLKATKKDYIIDATTKEVLEGNKIDDRVTVYRMVFERKTGILTETATEELETTNCPNCGAPTNITSSGKCEYCGSLITTDNHDWVLTRLEPIINAH